MANETIDGTIESLENLGDSAEKAQAIFNSVNDTIHSTSVSFVSLNDELEKSDMSFDAINNTIKDYKAYISEGKNLTAQHTVTMGLLTTAILGTRKSLDSLNTGTQLNTFEAQWDSLTKTMLEGGGGLGALVNKAKELLGSELPKSATQSVGALSTFMSNVMKSADNVSRMSTAMLAAAAATGSLGSMYKGAGEHLENLNELAAQQRMALIASAEAAHILPEQMEKNFASLMMVPKALDTTVTSSRQMADAFGGAASQTSLLTATTLLAAGSGRKYEDVVSDLNKAYQEYGLTGDSALKFTARMGEVSNNLGIDLNSVRNSLSGAADMFGKFADAGESASTMAEGLATILNSYSQSLMSTGMTGNHALGVVKNMTGAISEMSIAQKSFLSLQSGGAGGLMGGFQIEKMLRSGDIAGVFDKVREAMKKQMGTIVTLDEASESPAAAAQLTKQMIMLKQGPLGQFAKTDQDAYRILEAFKTREQGGAVSSKSLQDDIVGATMDKGLDFQEKTSTEATKLRIIAEKQLAAADFANMRLIQSRLTAGTGDGKIADSAAMAEYRNQLKAFAAEGSVTSGELTNRYSRNLSGAGSATTTDTAAETATRNLQDIDAMITSAVGAGKEQVAKMMSVARDKISELEGKVSGAKNNIERTKLQDEISQKHDQLIEFSDLLNTSFLANRGSKAVTPGSVLAQAPGGTPKVPGDTANNEGGAEPPGGRPGTAHAQHVRVTVDGFCLKCKQEIDGGHQAKGVAPQSQ